MVCKKCGKQLEEEGGRTCPYCGGEIETVNAEEDNKITQKTTGLDGNDASGSSSMSLRSVIRGVVLLVICFFIMRSNAGSWISEHILGFDGDNDAGTRQLQQDIDTYGGLTEAAQHNAEERGVEYIIPEGSYATSVPGE